jgi:hypothetical protein
MICGGGRQHQRQERDPRPIDRRSKTINAARCCAASVPVGNFGLRSTTEGSAGNGRLARAADETARARSPPGPWNRPSPVDSRTRSGPFGASAHLALRADADVDGSPAPYPTPTCGVPELGRAHHLRRSKIQPHGDDRRPCRSVSSTHLQGPAPGHPVPVEDWRDHSRSAGRVTPRVFLIGQVRRVRGHQPAEDDARARPPSGRRARSAAAGPTPAVGWILRTIAYSPTHVVVGMLDSDGFSSPGRTP